jgi:glycosyltransferase involved in cell wall biosynthesis
MHPITPGMEKFFTSGRDLIFFDRSDWGQLVDIIRYYLEHDQARETIRKQGHELVKSKYTYKQRLEFIFETIGMKHIESNSKNKPRSNKLNLGAGRDIKEGYDNLDMTKLPGVNIVHDLNEYPWPIEDETYDKVEAWDVFEHLENVPKTMDECHRILKENGTLFIRVPDARFPEKCWIDPTHKRGFCPESFDYWDDDTFLAKHYGFYSSGRWKIIDKKEANYGLEWNLKKVGKSQQTITEKKKVYIATHPKIIKKEAKDIRVGLIARTDDSGLGNLTHEFYRHIRPYKTLAIDFSIQRKINSHPEWYPNARICRGGPDEKDMEWLLEDVDIVYTAETPYNYDLYTKAEKKGIPIILHYMYEFLANRSADVPYPTVLLSPSLWFNDEIKQQMSNKCKVDYLPVPVNRKLCKFRKINKAKKFLHVVGRQTEDDRNGTDIFLNCLPHVKSDVEFIMSTQGQPIKVKDKRLRIRKEVDKYQDMYVGDVLVMPRRFGGLCLPLNESMSCGMVPIMTDLPPQNGFLHKDSLIPINDKIYRSVCQFNVYDANPKNLAMKIDEMANKDIGYLNKASDEYADSISWDNMKEKYLQLFKKTIDEYKRT